MATQNQLEVLEDIFGHLDYPEKVQITLDQTSRTVVITYPDMDEEWFKELQQADGSGDEPT